ncbi:MAG: ABC transporter ATP-binding protein [Moraxella sp.]|nr:ABC transporter ATP-binding protein [Moraxella sp.]
MKLLVENLAVAFDGKSVFSEVSFGLGEGEIACLLGRSGCGKTTVLRAIMGFCTPQAGRISLDGAALFDEKTNTPAHLRNIGMVFQDYGLFPHLTVADNITFGIKSLSNHEKKSRLDELLTLIDMVDFASRYPHELSGGQQQRVALARALVPRPRLLLLDEPFSNLDVNLKASLSFEVRQLLKKEGVSAILVTHDQAEAFAMADKVGVMADMKLHQWASPSELYARPVSAAVASFVGEGVLLPAEIIDTKSAKTAIGMLPCANAHAFSVGEQVTMLVRPEAVSLVPVQTAAAVMTLQKQLFLGGHWLCTLSHASGASLTVRLPATSSFELGETVGVDVSSGWAVTGLS